MNFTPRPYQQIGIGHIVNTPRCGLWAGMGMGKSATVLEALLRLDICEVVFPALVIAPLRVAKTTWPDEVKKWGFPLNISVICGTATERSAALQKQADVYTINYENLPWLLETLDDHWPFLTVIADESTKLKGFRLNQGTQRSKALAKVAHKRVTRFVNLTGTPAPNGLIDLWGQSWFLDGGVRLGRSYSAFQERWFQALPGGDGYIQWRPLAHAQGEIQNQLKDICLTLDPHDWFDLREPIRTIVTVDLPDNARELYDQFESELFMEIEGHSIEAFNAATKTIKCLQLANGAAYVDEMATWKAVHDAKLDALKDIVEEAAGASLLVAYHFKSDLARIRKAIPHARELDQDPQTIRQWNDGSISVLLAHPASAGHGLNLQDGGHHIVFFGHWWDMEQRQQIIERIGPVRQLQAGHDRPVWIYDIVARGTVDEVVLKRHETKRQVQDLLLDAMKKGARQ